MIRDESALSNGVVSHDMVVCDMVKVAPFDKSGFFNNTVDGTNWKKRVYQLRIFGSEDEGGRPSTTHMSHHHCHSS